MGPLTLEHATPQTFDAQVQAPEDTLVVVYFWGPECPNCEIFARDLPGLLEELPQVGLKLVKVNAYEHTELAQRFALFGIPGFVLLRGGKKLGMMRQYYGRDYWLRVITEQVQGAPVTTRRA
jgi:thioredoxin-like negative regulator of GroEL